MLNDLMENIEWFFNLHDKNKDGYLTKDEVLTLSESFLVSLSTFAEVHGLIRYSSFSVTRSATPT
jgi:Ca2+-binding EF-hand superfamily protein